MTASASGPGDIYDANGTLIIAGASFGSGAGLMPFPPGIPQAGQVPMWNGTELVWSSAVVLDESGA